MGRMNLQRLVRIALLPTLILASAPLALWRAQEKHPPRAASPQQINSSVQRARRYRDVRIPFATGSLTLKNLKLVRMMESTIVKGKIVNHTNRKWDRLSLEIRAYDSNGNLLRGAESTTIFDFHQLRARASMPLNSGYGVWLEAIPFDAVSRLEVSVIGEPSTINF